MAVALPHDPEFALLAAITARPANLHRAAAVAAAVSGGIDWLRFLRLVARHRLAPLAFDGLTDVRGAVPDNIHRDLRAAAMRDRTNALQLVGILAAITARLSAAGVATMSFKGPTLALLAFGDASLRQSRDLDILIRPEDVARAFSVLHADFHPTQPAGFNAADQALLSDWHAKDVCLLHESTGAIIELHWRLNSNPYLIPATVAASRQTVTFGPVATETLAPDDLLLYLCVHGAVHYWFRLKWLTDIYALLAHGESGAIRRFYDYALAYELDIPAGQVLLLLEQVYGVTIPDAIKTNATKSWRVRRLTRLARRYLYAIEEPEHLRFAPTVMSLGRLLLHRRPHYVVLEVVAMLIDWPVARRLGLTHWAYTVAILGRPMFWIARKVRQPTNSG